MSEEIFYVKFERGIYVNTTLIRRQSGAFRTRRFSENGSFAFLCGEETFWKQSFENDGVIIIMICSLPEVYFELKYKMTGDFDVFKFLQRLVSTESVWSVVYKFLLRSMEEA